MQLFEAGLKVKAAGGAAEVSVAGVVLGKAVMTVVEVRVDRAAPILGLVTSIVGTMQLFEAGLKVKAAGGAAGVAVAGVVLGKVVVTVVEVRVDRATPILGLVTSSSDSSSVIQPSDPSSEDSSSDETWESFAAACADCALKYGSVNII